MHQFLRRSTKGRPLARSSSRSRRRGAATVEFAIVGSLFFVTILAMFEFGRLNIIRHTADNAAYEAARQCMVPGATVSEAEDVAMRIMNIVGTRDTSVTVTPAVIGPDTNEITVTVEVPMNRNAIVAARFSGTKTIQSTVTLRTERPVRRS